MQHKCISKIPVKSITPILVHKAYVMLRQAVSKWATTLVMLLESFIRLLIFLCRWIPPWFVFFKLFVYSLSQRQANALSSPLESLRIREPLCSLTAIYQKLLSCLRPPAVHVHESSVEGRQQLYLQTLWNLDTLNNSELPHKEYRSSVRETTSNYTSLRHLPF